jgi:primary-amine oxidase
MRNISASFASVITLCTVTALLPGQATTPQHPLDGLTTKEYWTVQDVLIESGHMTDKTLVASLLLHEPTKDKVLAWKAGDPMVREADVVLIDNADTVEAKVNISAHSLESGTLVAGVQAPITGTELDTMSDVLTRDPRVVEALKKRGITNLVSVRCEPIPITFIVFPQQLSHRIGYADCGDSHGEYHAWGRAIAGLYILADLTTQKILEVTDRGAAPMPTGNVDYEEADAKPREGTKPLLVSQPEGPGYIIDKGEVTWQNWHFRFRLDPRVGAVVNQVGYQDGARLRSVMYEGSLSEMYVPYMDPEDWWNSRVFLDAGEFLMGGLLKPLGADDCPPQAQYFTGLVPSDHGSPVLKPQLACLFEHAQDGPAWRHSENGVISGRPARELVLRTSAVLGNYDYVLDWVFQQDGTIRVAVGATGIVETKAVKEEKIADPMGGPGSHPEYGTLVEPNLVAVNHDHYFSFRLDLDVDGPNNSFMVDRLVPQQLSGSVRKSIWKVESSMAHTEKDAMLDLDPRRPAMWSFINPSQHDAVGYPTGYEIMPGATGVSFVSPDDPAQRVGAFSEHQLWVTQYHPDELYASGTYVNSSKGLEGLPAWTKANRSIQDTDLVAWYTLGFHHSVRLEDWPVMPTLWHDFLIRPVNFFDRNPALTLPHQP